MGLKRAWGWVATGGSGMKWEKRVKGRNFQLQNNYEDAMYTTMIIGNNIILRIWKLLREHILNVLIIRKKYFFVTLVTNFNYIYCIDHFTVGTNTKSWCISQTNKMLYANYTSIKKKHFCVKKKEWKDKKEKVMSEGQWGNEFSWIIWVIWK